MRNEKKVREFLKDFLGGYYPLSEEEILLEILKELKELNSNVKAIIARIDADREQQEAFREKVIELLIKQVKKPF